MTSTKSLELEIDCLKMKEDIQSKLLKARRKNLTTEEEVKEANEKLRGHHIFGPLCRRQVEKKTKEAS